MLPGNPKPLTAVARVAQGPDIKLAVLVGHDRKRVRATRVNQIGTAAACHQPPRLEQCRQGSFYGRMTDRCYSTVIRTMLDKGNGFACTRRAPAKSREISAGDCSSVRAHRCLERQRDPKLLAPCPYRPYGSHVRIENARLCYCPIACNSDLVSVLSKLVLASANDGIRECPNLVVGTEEIPCVRH